MSDNLIYTVGHLVWPLQLYGHNRARCHYCKRPINNDYDWSVSKGKIWHSYCLSQVKVKANVN